MKFEVIVGNPPYQGVNHQQIYPQFYLWSRKNCDQMSMIFPSNWQKAIYKNGLKLMNTEDVKYDKQIVSIDNIDDIDEGLFDEYNVPEYIRQFVRENIQPMTIKNIIGYDGKYIDLFYKV